MKKSYHYPCYVFRQQEKSPLQVAFVANAGDIVAWSGIPRKSDELLTGFQRLRDDNRIDQEVVPFFQRPENCSPTALIVGLRRDSGLGGCHVECSIPRVGEIAEGQLTIFVDEDDLKTDRVFESALNFVNERLGKAPHTGELAQDEEPLEDENDSAEAEEISHLGSVTLEKMRQLLEDRSNWRKPAFQQAIADYVKPAMLIDGQHRVWAGAKFGQKGLPFIVCGLYDVSWSEQVFQFTVVNLKPKRIPPSLITSIAGLSLTRQEQDQVEGRLEQAGVRVSEVAMMSLVAYDPASPFAEMIDMSVAAPGKKSELLGYGSMKRIASVWYRGNRSSLSNIAQQAFATASPTAAILEWRDSKAWFSFFVKFWSAVREKVGENLWRKFEGNRLMIGATLWAFQEAILLALDGQMPSYWKVEGTNEERESGLSTRMLEVVNTTLTYFPEELWTMEWARNGQDTGNGRQELLELFNRFVTEGKKHGKWKAWKKDPWFAGDE